jgi:DNA-binding SARP family transcriptional activator/tetratricopeptide (TPR) repeat protein
VPLWVGVLGPVTAWLDERERPAGPPRQLAVLGVLATRANQVVALGQLVDAVWGDQPPASAEGGIYTYVAGLRRVLEPDRPRRAAGAGQAGPPAGRVLISASGGYQLRLAADGLDAGQFESRLRAARELRARGDLPGAAGAVDEALALWRGQPFAGIPGPFAAGERQRLGDLRISAAEARADLMLARGQDAAALPELAALVAEHPLRERARGLLMIALYRTGRQAEALRVFHDVRERLADELGIDPGTELTGVYRRLLAMDPALDRPPAAVDGDDRVREDVKAAAAPSRSPADPPVAAVPAPAAPAEPAPPALPAPPAAPRPAQLPSELASFAGRTAELHWLHGLLPDGDGSPGAPAALITGTAGVGKTTLAVRFARQVMASFPDGQLYVNLRGFDPASSPVAPGPALQGFLEALGVPSRHVPPALEAASALLRTLLATRRVLFLLDNAHDAEQVRPLLPGSPGCLVVVTSRSQLTGLVVTEGARPLPLDVLGVGEATELLTRRLGAARVIAEPDAVAALVDQAAGLPLALSVACARAAARPTARLADLSAELADALDRLDALRTGEVTTDLRAVFSWSVAKLSEPAARTFRLLGLHPGPDIAAPATASLTAASLTAARAALAELTRASLLTEDADGRFGCHDLLRAYAAELAQTQEDEAERCAARRRLLDHYVGTALAASGLLYPARGQVVSPEPAPGVSTERFDGGQAYEAAVAWFLAENRVLRSLLDLAAAQGEDEHCWQLAWYWAPLLKRRGRLHEVLGVQQVALAAAGRLGDSAALGHVHYDFGHVSSRLGDYQAAGEHLHRALELFTARGDLVSVAQARHGIALLLCLQDRFAEALEHELEALRLRRAFADPAAVAYSENGLGWILAHLGRPAEGIGYLERALERHRASGSRTGIADTLDSIGHARGELADHDAAMGYFQQALDLYRQIGDPEAEASVLLHLGDAQLAALRPADARDSWQQAIAVLSAIPGADTGAFADRVVLLGRAAGSPGASAGLAVLAAAAEQSVSGDAVKLLTDYSERLVPLDACP